MQGDVPVVQKAQLAKKGETEAAMPQKSTFEPIVPIEPGAPSLTVQKPVSAGGVLGSNGSKGSKVLGRSTFEPIVPIEPGTHPLIAAFNDLAANQPQHLNSNEWLWAVEDGRHFLGEWGGEAARLSWTANDLFGLPPIPEKPAPNYRRLSRYDLTGLVWMLRGRQVVALSADRAVIATPREASIRSAGYPGSIQRGSIAFYRRP
jgi:hypothetical protein